jgi:hypothetical protein
MQLKNPAVFTPPTEHGVHKKSRKNKRENQSPYTGKNPRITLFWADRHLRSFARGDIPLNNNAKDELLVWASCISDLHNWLPISHPIVDPPLCTKLFVSDAAGFPKNGIWNRNIGCASIGLDENSDTIFAFQLWWSKNMIVGKVDSKGVCFGDKTATLEQIGILLPLILITEKLTNQHILFKTDNLACVFCHRNKEMKGNACASILIRAVQLISAVLGSVIHIDHVQRCNMGK